MVKLKESINTSTSKLMNRLHQKTNMYHKIQANISSKLDNKLKKLRQTFSFERANDNNSDSEEDDESPKKKRNRLKVWHTNPVPDLDKKKRRIDKMAYDERYGRISSDSENFQTL